VDLGALSPPGGSSSAYGINNSGSVVGSDYNPASSETDAVLWQDGQRIDLGNLGFPQGGFPYSQAFAINDSGVAVGQSLLPDYEYHAFTADVTGIHDLGTLGGPVSGATAINADGVVVGHAQLAGAGVVDAFLYDEAGMHDLGRLGGNIAIAHGVNLSRVVVGEADTVGFGMTHAFLHDGTGIQDLGTLGGSESWAQAVNDSGQVVGTAYLGGDLAKHAFLYDGTGMHDLGTLPGYPQSGAYAINAQGDVVGFVATQIASFEGRAMLDQNGVLSDLNDLIPPDSGWVLRRATAINDSGQIAGIGQVGGYLHAFLLNPEAPAPGPGRGRPGASGWAGFLVATDQLPRRLRSPAGVGPSQQLAETAGAFFPGDPPAVPVLLSGLNPGEGPGAFPSLARHPLDHLFARYENGLWDSELLGPGPSSDMQQLA
jgi:probable HAF family extracellular repeat protein